MITPAVFAAFIVPAMLFRAYVLTALWGWYIVPGFGAAPLKMAIAFGALVIIAAFMSSSGDTKTGAQLLGASFVAPAFSLLWG